MVSISLFYFLTKHIAITNIKFVFIVHMVSTTLLSRSSICCAQNNEFINYMNFAPNTKSIEIFEISKVQFSTNLDIHRTTPATPLP